MFRSQLQLESTASVLVNQKSPIPKIVYLSGGLIIVLICALTLFIISSHTPTDYVQSIPVSEPPPPSPYEDSLLVFGQYEPQGYLNERGQLILFDANTGTKKQLYKHGVWDIYGWSPDNSAVLFNQVRQERDEFGHLRFTRPILTGIEVETGLIHESTLNAIEHTAWLTNDKIIRTFQNDIGDQKASIDTLSYPSFTKISSQDIKIWYFEEFSPDRTKVLTSTPPEDSKPILYDISTQQITYLKDLLPACTPDKHLRGSLWISSTMFAYNCGYDYFSFDLTTKVSKPLFSLKNDAGSGFSIIGGINVVANHIYFLRVYRSTQPDIDDVYEVEDYNIDTGTMTLLYKPRQDLHLNISDIAINSTGTLIAIIADSNKDDLDLSYIVNIKTGTVWDLCDTEDCANPIWSH